MWPRLVQRLVATLRAVASGRLVLWLVTLLVLLLAAPAVLVADMPTIIKQSWTTAEKT